MISISLLQIDHLGIRVTDLNRALDFYTLIGFEIDPSEDLREYQACALIHRRSGLRINLIYNADHQQGYNILFDRETKYPGITHFAMVVGNIENTIEQLYQHGVSITEGPIRVSSRRIACFVRDPDGNVLEFNQLI